MEYMSRGDQRPAAPAGGGHHKRFDWNGRAVRIEWFVFTALVALVLLVAIGWLIYSGSQTSSGESDRITKNNYQAVFLNGGATSGSVAYTTYFGHITKLTSSYVVLDNVYYLTTATSGTDQNQVNPQLTKLGCQQLHSPYDEMVINRSQVAFWENLKDSGKVVQAIKQFQQQNPNGPNCSANTSSSTNSTTNTQSTTPTTTKP
jgi:phage shock protein PspC (stress-responsive transcriptional regulator)